MVRLYVRNKNEIDKLMAIHGLTNIKLANSIGITPSYVSGIKNGRSIGRISATKFANKLGVKTKDIFFAASVDKSCTKPCSTPEANEDEQKAKEVSE